MIFRFTLSSPNFAFLVDDEEDDDEEEEEESESEEDKDDHNDEPSLAEISTKSGKGTKRVFYFLLHSIFDRQYVTSLRRAIDSIFRHQKWPQFNSKLSIFTTQCFSGNHWIVSLGYNGQQH